MSTNENSGAENEELGKAEYTEGTELPEKSTVSEEKQEEMAKESPTEQAEERPIGVEEQEKIEEQSESHTQVPTMTSEKPKSSEKKDDYQKLFKQFTKHFATSKIANDKTTDLLKQIQKQLVQVEKISETATKQQVVIKQLANQVKTVQKQLDKIGSSISRIKTFSPGKGKNTKNKRKKI